jgi:hypothetical protein
MKDAKGHGSDARGGQLPSGAQGAKMVAAALGVGMRGETWGSRYATGEQHTAALADQHGIGTDHLMSDSERSQKIADWRDKGTSDAQAREGIRAMFNLPSRE